MRNFRCFILRIFIISFLAMVVGCSSGGGGSQGQQSAVSEGTLTGTYTKSDGSLQFPATALITMDGLVGIDIGNGVVFYGELGANNVMNGSENISPNAIVTLTPGNNNSGQLSVNVTQGAYALSAGDTFIFSYNDIYDRTSSLSNLVGTWSGNNTIMTGGSGVGQDWSITFLSDGTFTGSSGDIDITGSATLVDPTKNEYEISMTLSHNSINYSLLGDYQGFAFLTDSSAMNDTLMIFIKRTGTDAYLGRLILQ